MYLFDSITFPTETCPIGLITRPMKSISADLSISNPSRGSNYRPQSTRCGTLISSLSLFSLLMFYSSFGAFCISLHYIRSILLASFSFYFLFSFILFFSLSLSLLPSSPHLKLLPSLFFIPFQLSLFFLSQVISHLSSLLSLKALSSSLGNILR